MFLLVIMGIACIGVQVYALADLAAKNCKDETLKTKLQKAKTVAVKGLAGCAGVYLLAVIGLIVL